MSARKTLMKTITLNQVVGSLEGLNQLGKTSGLGFKLSYDIAYNSESIKPYVVSYETTVKKYVQDNGELNEDGTYALKDVSKQQELTKKIDDLLSQEITIEFYPLEYKSFEDVDIKAEVIRPILWMID